MEHPLRRAALLVTSVLTVGGAVALTGGWVQQLGHEATDAASQALEAELARTVERRVASTLDGPLVLNRLNRAALASGRLDLRDDEAWIRAFAEQLEAFPSIGYVQLGRDDGSFVGVERAAQGLVVEVTLPDRSGKGVFPLGPDGWGGPPRSVVVGYDATTRPWYRAAAEAQGPAWSSIYQLSSRDAVRLAITAAEAVPAPDGTGAVVGADLMLATLSRHLEGLEVPPGARVFLVERDGALVAASFDPRPFHTTADRATRRRLADVDDPWARAAAAALAPSLAALDGWMRAPLSVEGLGGTLRATPLRDGRGVDWVLGVVLLDGTVLPGVAASHRRATWWLLVAVALSSVIGGFVAQLQFQRLLDERTAAMRQAVEADAAKSVFLAGMSHELRNPMNAILGYTELMLEDATGQSREDLGRVMAAAQRLRKLIDQVLDLSRVEAGAVAVTVEPVDVQALVAGVFEELAPAAARQEVALSAQLGGVVTLRSDADLLHQCLLNLVSNAVKYAPGGPVVVEASEQRGVVRFDVVDQGPGIDPSRRATLFQPFARGPGGAAGLGSTGLGLALTRRMAEALGGTVTAVPASSGSRFRLEVASALDPSPGSDTPGGSPVDKLRGKATSA